MMARDEYVFYKVSILSLCLWFILGMALGLLVFCPVVHAETTCPTTLDAEAERCRSQGYREYHDNMRLYNPGPYRPNTLGPYEGDLFEKQANCYTQMEAAMRAMDEFVDQKQKDYEIYDGCNYCDSRGCTVLACPLGGNEVARLEWELKQARKKEEAAKQRAVALKQWEQAKACWRKP